MKQNNLLIRLHRLGQIALAGLPLICACSPALIGGLGGSTGSSAGLTISATFGATAGGTYALSDAGPRTITFTHNGTSALCSHNGGTTYSACDTSNTLIFSDTEYGSAVLKIKVSKSGYADVVHTITLPTDLPGVAFSACDSTITPADFDAIDAALGAVANRVVCITAGATIADANGPVISFGANGQKVIGLGTGATRPLLTTTNNVGTAHAGIFLNNGFTGTVISNLRLAKSTSGTGAGAVVVQAGDLTATSIDCDGGTAVNLSGSCFYNQDTLTLNGSTLTASASNSTPLRTDFGSVTTSSSVTISQTHATTGIAVFAGGNVTMSDCTISASDSNFATWSNQSDADTSISSCTISHSGVGTCAQAYNGGFNGALTLSNSTISAPHSICGAMSVQDPQTGTTNSITNTTIVSGSYGLGILDLDTAAATPAFQLSGVTIKHSGTASSINEVALYITGTQAGTLTLNSASDGNRFCNVGTGAPWFTSVLGGNQVPGGGTFALANQVNAGALHTCP